MIGVRSLGEEKAEHQRARKLDKGGSARALREGKGPREHSCRADESGRERGVDKQRGQALAPRSPRLWSHAEARAGVSTRAAMRSGLRARTGARRAAPRLLACHSDTRAFSPVSQSEPPQQQVGPCGRKRGDKASRPLAAAHLRGLSGGLHSATVCMCPVVGFAQPALQYLGPLRSRPGRQRTVTPPEEAVKKRLHSAASLAIVDPLRSHTSLSESSLCHLRPVRQRVETSGRDLAPLAQPLLLPALPQPSPTDTRKLSAACHV